MYCLGCYYDLRGLTESRCPECGRTFNPDRPSSFSRTPHATPVRDLVDRVGKALEQALAPDDPQQILRRIRSSTASQVAEVDRLRRTNATLRAQLDFVLDVLEQNGLVAADELARLREEMARAEAHPIEMVEHLEPADNGAEEEPITADLLDLQRAAQQRHPAGE
jgi:hypothetical protein